MPLPIPIPDDRSFEQLRDALIRRIPVYAPEWTDHNESDPGVTLIELFAFLGETLLFRFNQIPETTRLAFLNLLDIPLRSAVSARAWLKFTTEKAGGVLVGAGSEVRAGKVPFETGSEVRVWPLSALAVGKITVASLPGPEKAVAEQALEDVGGLGPGDEAAYYVNRFVPLKPADPTATSVDFGHTADGVVWVAVLGEKGSDIKTLPAGILNLAVVLDPDVPTMAEIDACPGTAQGGGSPVIWQISTGVMRAGRTPGYRTVAVVGDTTGGLTRSGLVRIDLPKKLSDFGNFNPNDLEDPDLAGTGDLPPALEDEAQAAKVLFWLRAWRSDGSTLPRVAWVGLNGTDAVQERTARAEFLGVGDGQPDQRARLVNGQVVPGSVALDVEEAGGWVAWGEVEGFHASGPEDRHFQVDPTSGEVRFGRVIQGRAPQIGERIRVRSYRYGGGRTGNVGAGAINKVFRLTGPEAAAAGDVKVENVLPAMGGADAEAVEAALERMPGELRRRDRAVTAGDFQELALATPGAELGRAEVLPRFDPANPGLEAPGVVTVVVWPSRDAKHPDAPVPDRDTLRRVCCWLDQKRLVTTELYVVPPTYRPVAASLNLRVKPGYGVDAVRRWVELAIRQYLAPLPPYGPEGKGWPLGRRVHGPELEAAALQVEGVEYLEGDAQVAGYTAGVGWVAGTVTLAAYEVPVLRNIVVSTAAAPTPILEVVAGDEQPAAPPKRPVPVPVVPEAC